MLTTRLPRHLARGSTVIFTCIPYCAESQHIWRFNIYIDGKEIAVVKKYLHLSHIISAQLDDKDDILAKRNSFCGKINSVLCYFRSCDPLVKVKLLRHYCCDYYGSVIWNLSHNSMEDICVAWRKGLRRNNTHSRLISPVCDFLPVREELICRCVHSLWNV